MSDKHHLIPIVRLLSSVTLRSCRCSDLSPPCERPGGGLHPVVAAQFRVM